MMQGNHMIDSERRDLALVNAHLAEEVRGLGERLGEVEAWIAEMAIDVQSLVQFALQAGCVRAAGRRR